MSLIKKEKKEEIIILPVWGTMLNMSGICLCPNCENPEGPTYFYCLNNQHDASNFVGFYSCSKTICIDFMTNYINTLYYELYNSYKWNTILLKLANRTFVEVLRSNGNIETDWKLDISSYSDTDENLELLKQYSLTDIFISGMLCAYSEFNFHIPSVIWETIFYMTLDLYRKHVHVILGLNLDTYNTLETFIMVYKDTIDPRQRIGKLVDINTLLL